MGVWKAFVVAALFAVAPDCTGADDRTSNTDYRGEITPDSPRVDDLFENVTGDRGGALRASEVFRVEVDGTAPFRVLAISHHFDAYLVVRSSDGRIWTDDDSGPGLNAVLQISVDEPTTLEFVVASRDGLAGPLTARTTTNGEIIRVPDAFLDELSLAAIDLDRRCQHDRSLATPATASAQARYASLLTRSNHAEAGLPHALHALIVREQLFGLEALSTIDSCFETVATLYQLGERKLALPLAERAVHGRLIHGNSHSLLRALSNLAATLRAVDRENEALTVLRLADAMFTPAGKHTATLFRIEFQANLGNALRDAGHLSESLRVLRAAREAAQTLGNEVSIARSLHNESITLLRLGRIVEARHLVERARTIRARNFGTNGVRTLDSTLVLADVLDAAGEHERAIEHYRHCIANAGEPGAHLLARYAIALRNGGRYHEALDVFSRSLTGERTRLEGRVLLGLGVCQAQLGAYDDARSSLERAREILNATCEAHDRLLGDVLHAHGLLARETGGDARPWLVRGLTVLEAALGRVHPRVHSAQLDLALVDYESGAWEDAYARVCNSGRLTTEESRAGLIANARADLLMAACARSLGNRDVAYTHTLDAIHRISRAKALNSQMMASALAMMCQLSPSDLDTLTAIEQASAIFASHGVQTAPSFALARKHAQHLINHGRDQEAAKLLDASLHDSQQRGMQGHGVASIGATLTLLHLDHERISSAVDVATSIIDDYATHRLNESANPLAARLRSTHREGWLLDSILAACLAANAPPKTFEVHGLEAGISAMGASALRGSTQRADNLRAGHSAYMRDLLIQALDGDFQNAHSTAQLASEAQRSLVRPDLTPPPSLNVTLEDVRSSLSHDDVYVHFAVRRPRQDRAWSAPVLSAWVVTTDDARFVDLGDYGEVQELIAGYRQEMGIARGSLPSASYANGTALYERLWQALQLPNPSSTKPRTCYLYVEGDLHYLPFDALRRPDKRHLVERNNIVYVACPQALVQLAPDAFEWTGGRVVAVDGVEFGGGGELGDERTAREWTYLGSQRTATLERLAIRNECVVLTGSNATASALTEALSTPSAMIHLSTHAEVGAKPWDGVGDEDWAMLCERFPFLDSYLVLSGASTSQAHTGVMSAHDVLTLDLEGCKLAVLAACETGVGIVHDSRSPISLRRAFHGAGVAQVIASSWRVGNADTARLLDDFYEQLEMSGDASEALWLAKKAQAQRSRETFGSAMPSRWAGFTLSIGYEPGD